jgi:hypothetical protein
MNKRLLLCLSLAALGGCLLGAESSALLSPKVPASDPAASSAPAAAQTTGKAAVTPKAAPRGATKIKAKAVVKKSAARTLSGKIVSIRPAAKGSETLVLRSGKRDLKVFVSAALSGKLTGLRVGRIATLRYHLVAGEREWPWAFPPRAVGARSV